MHGNVIIESPREGEYSLAVVTVAWVILHDGGRSLIFRLCTKMSLGLLLCLLVSSFSRCQAPDASKLSVRWDKVVRVSKTTPTLQVVVNPPLRRGAPVHDNAFRALHDLQADYVRYVPWLPYPKLGVAELDPPADGKTSWDF
jgi:hypothetical protein